MTQTIINGVTINHSNSNAAFWAAIGNGKWEQFTFDSISNNVVKGGVFIDIGAWVGAISVFAEKLGFIVYALEPDNKAFYQAQELFSLNKCKATVKPFAISGSNGEAYLNTQSSFGNSESSLIDRGNIAGTAKVPTMTLSHYLSFDGITPEDVSFIKIDIEGGEIDLLIEAQDFISKYKPTMHISFHPAWINDLETVIEQIYYLFDTYDVISDAYIAANADNFIELLNSHQHSFLFKAR